MSIVVRDLTKTFTPTAGIHNLTFDIKEGEVFGFLGPNGAGKTTTIRNLMGFMHPDSGSATIDGLDCWKQSAEIKKHVGYVPGEINFVEGMNGIELLNLLGRMRGLKDVAIRNRLIERFDINIKTTIKKMSKGMKQKIGIIAAFMHDPKTLILDEPTSGLDPLMQNEFVSLILEEKKRGKTIFMSSHIFEEVQLTCDRVSIIKDGVIAITDHTSNLVKAQRKVYKLTVKTAEDIALLKNSGMDIVSQSGLEIAIRVKENFRVFFASLAECDVTDLDVVNKGLEETFLHLYGKEDNSHE
jgi:ABC-2 type transport system ATP-binding protein